ncbi:MAG TPA: tRNA (guanosine(46)-N7)-methyltransferase TrmB [Verrucomicrobiae bacterium]|nr:tRNA (guanosine(46)-N7)-methyltransferase TrmB [Verrucomicrobiae bacterium]
MQTFPTSIYVPANWVMPLDWDEIFGNTQRIEVDIGCGKGSFLLWAARTRAEMNFVGVDRLVRRLRKIDRKIQRLSLPNVRLLRVEASYFVGFLVPDLSVSVYHVYFPDPWPKRRHRQRRLISAGFLSNLHRTLCEGGAVNCATDSRDYYEWIERQFHQLESFRENEPEILPDEACTDFEREFSAAGKGVYRCRWVKE